MDMDRDTKFCTQIQDLIKHRIVYSPLGFVVSGLGIPECLLCFLRCDQVGVKSVLFTNMSLDAHEALTDSCTDCFLQLCHQ